MALGNARRRKMSEERRSNIREKEETSHGTILVDNGTKRIHELLQIQASATICVRAIKPLFEGENLADGNRAAFGFADAV